MSTHGGDPLHKSFLRGMWTLIALSVVDVVTTIWALALGASELNPLALFLISHGWIIPASMLGLIIPAKILVLGIGLWRIFSKNEWKVAHVSSVWWVCGVYSLGMLLNIVHLFLLL